MCGEDVSDGFHDVGSDLIHRVTDDQPVLRFVLIDVAKDLFECEHRHERDRRLAREFWPGEFDPSQCRAFRYDPLINRRETTPPSGSGTTLTPPMSTWLLATILRS